MKAIGSIVRTALYAILAATAASCSLSEDTLHTLKANDIIAILPCDSTRMSVAISPHISARIDFGKAHSLISRKDLDLLKARDYNVDSSFCFALTRDLEGNIVMRTRRYTVDLPVYSWTSTSDSTGRVTTRYVGKRPDNVIYGIKFILAPEGESTTLALDLLRHTVFEYRYGTNDIVLHKAVPDGYQFVGNIYPSRHFNDLIGFASRYYIDLNINNAPHPFLVSTASGEAGIKLPTSELPSRSPLASTEIRDLYGYRDAICDQEGWVEYGNRAGTHPLYYYDSPVMASPYIFNPLYFFTQNSVADFPNGRFYLRPHVSNRRHRPTHLIDDTATFVPDSLTLPPDTLSSSPLARD